MAAHYSGPLVVSPPTGSSSGTPPDAGPSLFQNGVAIMDSRVGYSPGQAANYAIPGWFATPSLEVVNAVPSTISTVAIAAAAVPVAGTALTLVAASGAGITVGVTINRADTGAAVTGLLAIDGAAALKSYGVLGTSSVYDPTTNIARNVQILSVGDDHLATVTVRGYDIYNYPMSETITLSNATTAVGKKAFKYIASITPAGTLSGSNISVGQGDVYGFPIRSDNFFYTTISWNALGITATTGYVAAVTTSPATATTGDVRGTYAVQSASDNAKRLIVFQRPSVALLGTAVGLTGVTQA